MINNNNKLIILLYKKLNNISKINDINNYDCFISLILI